MSKDRSVTYGNYEAKGTGDLEVNRVEVQIRYNDGNFSGVRGYYASISPLKIEGRWQTYVGFSGQRALIERANRYSQKRLEALLQDDHAKYVLGQVLTSVLAKQGVTLLDKCDLEFTNYGGQPDAA